MQHTNTFMDFEKMKLKELQTYCKKNKIKGYSIKNKNELITHIKNIRKTLSEPSITQKRDIKYTRKLLNKEKICLISGDCLDIMSEIESKSIDLILCDLPYGVTKK